MCENEFYGATAEDQMSTLLQTKAWFNVDSFKPMTACFGNDYADNCTTTIFSSKYLYEHKRSRNTQTFNL